MKKRMTIMLICLFILFGNIFLYKMFVNFMIKKSIGNQLNIITVSAMEVPNSTWQPKLTASGSLRAIQGVDVTTELAGMVQKIYFKPGSQTTKNDVLVQLNADSDIARLQALEANVSLAKTTLSRDKAQYAIRAVSQQTLETDAANLKNLEAQVAEQAAIVAKKTLKAPFSGKLGINLINPGQYLNPGDKVVSLQSLNPIYADFYIPQQKLAALKLGQKVTITTSTFPKKTFKGSITTINPAIDINTRNIGVEATIDNPDETLVPGMFVSVEIVTGEPTAFLTIPQTAVSFNPYGDIVYIIHKVTKDNKPILTVTQHFVTTGETRGEQVKVLKGLKAGDMIVTSGQLKLKNGSEVVIDNSLAPSNNPAPDLKNNH